MKTTPREAVAALGEAVARRVGAPRYQLWFERHTKYAWDEPTLTVGVPNRHFGEYLEKTFRAAIGEAAREVFGPHAEVRFAIDPQLFQAARREQAEAREAQTPPPALPRRPLRKRAAPAPRRPASAAPPHPLPCRMNAAPRTRPRVAKRPRREPGAGGG